MTAPEPARVLELVAELRRDIEWQSDRPCVSVHRAPSDFAVLLAAAEAWPAAQERIAELEAALEEARKPRDRSQTHSEGCWRWRHHHECAIARVEELEAENARLRAQLDAAQSEASAVAVGTREPQT